MKNKLDEFQLVINYSKKDGVQDIHYLEQGIYEITYTDPRGKLCLSGVHGATIVTDGDDERNVIVFPAYMNGLIDKEYNHVKALDEYEMLPVNHKEMCPNMKPLPSKIIIVGEKVKAINRWCDEQKD